MSESINVPINVQCHCCRCDEQPALSSSADPSTAGPNQNSCELHLTSHCSNKIPYFYPNSSSLEIALRQHGVNFIDLVDDQLPLLGWIYKILGKNPPKNPKTEYRLSLAEMHRMYMRALQIDLTNMGVAMVFDANESASEMKDELSMRKEQALRSFVPALRQYTHAIRDYEYMTTGLAEYDYFIVSSERCHDRIILKTAMFDYDEVKEKLHNKSALHTGPWEYLENNRAEPIGGTRHEGIKTISRKVFWWKLSAAFIGAGFLVGPMWLLALEQRLYLQLEVTTGFVLSFGITLAYFMEKIDQVFAGTLAYAAVLMVFVGLSVQGVGGT
jgi:hypothetical protein